MKKLRIIAIAIAMLVSLVASRWLFRFLAVDRCLDRGGATVRTLNDWCQLENDLIPFGVLHHPISWTIVLGWVFLCGFIAFQLARIAIAAIASLFTSIKHLF